MRRQDIAALLVYWAGYSWVRNLAFRLRGEPVTRFICFHDVLPQAEAEFIRKLEFLRAHTNVVSCADYLAGRLSPSRLNVVITFDDGYKSWARVAAPALGTRGLPATFFVSSGFVDLSAQAEADFVRYRLQTELKTSGGLSSLEVREMARSGFTIGGHTCSHVELSKVEDRREVDRELLVDKSRLEEMAEKPVDYFAYPFGQCQNPRFSLTEAVESAGYAAAVTVKPGANRLNATQKYLLLRELTDAPMPLSVFRARLCGCYDLVLSLKARTASARAR